MIRKLTIVIALLPFIFQGATVRKAQALQKIVTSQEVESVSMVTDLIPVADNVVILFDTSSSMGAPYKNSGKTKLQAAKELLLQRVKQFPDAFPNLKVGLYSYASSPRKLLDLTGYQVFHEMQKFDKTSFLQAVEQLPEKAGGATLLQNALTHLDKLLATLSGRTAVFLFTDGNYTKTANISRPIVLAKKLTDKYDVIFHLVSTTDERKQALITEDLASVNEASRVYPFETLLEQPEFLTGAVFVIKPSYIVSTETREKVVGFRLDNILFDFDESTIKADFVGELNAAGEMLQKKTDARILLTGFTDNHGTEEYNLSLSHRRADAVKDYLIRNFQIDESRIALFWYGENAAAANNATEDGRSKNRRAEGVILDVNDSSPPGEL